MLDFKGKAKWDAWNGKKGMDIEEARKAYVAYVKKMANVHGLIAAAPFFPFHASLRARVSSVTPATSAVE